MWYSPDSKAASALPREERNIQEVNKHKTGAHNHPREHLTAMMNDIVLRKYEKSEKVCFFQSLPKFRPILRYLQAKS